MPSFSERTGVKSPKAIQLDSMDPDLRNSLWNVCRQHIFKEQGGGGYLAKEPMARTAGLLYRDFYKLPLDGLTSFTSKFIGSQLKVFQEAQWHRLMDLLEFLHDTLHETKKESFVKDINFILEREKSAYRFIDGTLASVTNATEISEIEKATALVDRFAPVSMHIKSALALYSMKPTPDYRNTIKESISAIEAAAKIITSLPKATLDEALKAIDERHSLHGAFKQGVSKLYGYTSDAGGIRHSLMDATDIDETDARYMLVGCSAFANYLISRYDSLQNAI